jgi:hypothetical protein
MERVLEGVAVEVTLERAAAGASYAQGGLARQPPTCAAASRWTRQLAGELIERIQLLCGHPDKTTTETAAANLPISSSRSGALARWKGGNRRDRLKHIGGRRPTK